MSRVCKGCNTIVKNDAKCCEIEVKPICPRCNGDKFNETLGSAIKCEICDLMLSVSACCKFPVVRKSIYKHSVTLHGYCEVADVCSKCRKEI